VGEVWFSESRSVDLTGDGVSDSVALRAYGTLAESLDVDLSIYVGGEEVFRESWESGYELIDPPWDRPWNPAIVDSFMRAQFHTTIQGMSASPLPTTMFVRPAVIPADKPWEEGPVDMIASAFQWGQAGVNFAQVPPDSVRAVTARIEQSPYDTAEVARIAADIRAKTPLIVLLSYGYETVLELAWSNRAKRFFVLSACC